MKGRSLQSHGRWAVLGCAILATVVGIALRSQLRGETRAPISVGGTPLRVFANYSQEWDGEHGPVAVLRGQCRIIDGPTTYSAQKAVIWRQNAGAGESLTVYLEDDVRVDGPTGTSTEPALLVTLTSPSAVEWNVRGRLTGEAAREDALYQRAVFRRDGSRWSGLQQTQLTIEGDPNTPVLPLMPPSPSGSAGQIRRIRIFPRGRNFGIESFKAENVIPAESVTLITGGVVLLIEGLDQFGTIDLSADRAVVWTQSADGEGFELDRMHSSDTPFQVYLEGNIVVRQGLNVVRATRAFYDANEMRGLTLDAELNYYIPQLDSNIRVRAERIRQLSRNNFHAQNAWITTSPFGVPGYRIAATDIFVEERYGTFWSSSTVPSFDPATGQMIGEPIPWVTSLNNTFLVEEVPVFYLPYLAGPGEDPKIPIQAATFRQDRIFGTQFRTLWDAFGLFGIDRPPGVNLGLELDYLSERGPVIGGILGYQGMSDEGLPYFGRGKGYYVYDYGQDNLGRDRRALTPPSNSRGRLQLQDRRFFANNFSLRSEVGYVSDRNFLEQYFEYEFDREKDQETLVQLQQQDDTWAWTLLGQPRINDFEYQTQWLPKLDGYVLGRPLANGWINWSTHSSLAYASLEQAAPPTDPRDVFMPLPWFPNASGPVAMSRHGFDLPLVLGPVNVVPYVLGEAAYWGSGFTDDPISRIYGSAGVRSSLMMWRVYPYVQSDIFNLDGLAHKMTFDVNYYAAVSDRDLSTIPQYNEFDDNAQERFRERFIFNTFGGILPTIFDPRLYAVRSGAAQNVASPYSELVDDINVARFGWRHRLQTKIGPPERRIIKDWMTLDLGISAFPNPDRDNFGETFGLASGRYLWNVGERTSLFANALYDFFPGGQEVWNVGVFSQRSLRGSTTLALRQIKGGPLDSRIVTASYSYVMSPKWISTAGTAYDIGINRNLGQQFMLTRVGADFLVHLGANYNASKNNAGLTLSIEPRFGSPGVSATQIGTMLSSGPSMTPF